MKRQEFYIKKIKKLKIYILSLIGVSMILTGTLSYVIHKLSEYSDIHYRLINLRTEYDQAVAEIEVLEGEVLEAQTYASTLRADNYISKVSITTDVGFGRTPLVLFQTWIRKQTKIAYLEEYFIEYAIKYNIDVGYAAAIYVKEVGRHNNVYSWLNNNNPAGIKSFEGCRVVDGYCMYATPKDGIHAMFKLLSKYYDGSMHGVKLRTVKQTRDKWSARKDEYEVVNIWNEMFVK